MTQTNYFEQTNYFDSSALVKRYVTEIGSAWVQNRCDDPTHIITLADIGRVEIAAAFASKWRGNSITQNEYQRVRAKLTDDVQQEYQTVPVIGDRINEAINLTAQHKLRGYDAVHLACALYLNQVLLSNGRPSLIFVSADDDLLIAAQANGLTVENPNQYP